MPPRKDSRKEKKIRITDETLTLLDRLREPYSRKRYVELLIQRNYDKRFTPVLDQIDKMNSKVRRQIGYVQQLLGIEA